MPYITPDRFRAMGFGLDLTTIEEVELRQVIARASALVDAYCAVPMLPVAHDFRGGTISGEQHSWRLPDLTMSSAAGSRRVYPYHRPLKTITSFVVKFTNTFQVEINPSNLYVHQSEGWAEVVSIASVVSACLYPVGINFGLYTPVAEVAYTYGWDLSTTGEYLEPTDAGTYRSANCWWKTSPAPVVYKNGAVQSSGYTVDPNEGVVTFSSLLAATDVVTADYSYKMPGAIGDATGFIASHLLGDRRLQERGMAGVGLLRVAEVEIRRQGEGIRGGSAQATIESMNPSIGVLLAPYVFDTVR